MTCPICDQKPSNCDCTDTEREIHNRCVGLESELDEARSSVDGALDQVRTLTAERDAALARANAAEARVRDLEGTLMGMGAESSTRADVIRGLRARVKELEAEAIELEATATRAVDHDDTQNARVRLENAALKKALDETHDICAQLSAQLDAHKRALDEALFSGDARRAAEDSDTHVWRNHIRATAKGETK